MVICKTPLIALGMFAAGLSTHRASAVVLYSDDFSGNTLDAGWRPYGDNAPAVLSVDGGVFKISPQNNNRAVSYSFSDVTLGLGDSLSVSFNVKPNSVRSGSKMFRFGFFNSVDAGAANAGDAGYFAGVEWSPTVTANAGLFADLGSDDWFMMGTDTSSLNQAASNYGMTTVDWFACEFVLTRVDEGMRLAARFGGEELFHTVTDGATSTFNGFAVQEYDGKTVYYLDDVQINLTNVPEPSVFGVVFAGAAGGACLLRRRCKKIRFF